MRRKMKSKKARSTLRLYQSGVQKGIVMNSGDIIYSTVVTAFSGWANLLSPAIELIPRFKRFVVKLHSLQHGYRAHLIPCLVRLVGTTIPTDKAETSNLEIHSVIDSLYTADHTTEVLPSMPLSRYAWYDSTLGNHYSGQISLDLTAEINAYLEKRFSQPGAVDTDTHLVLCLFSNTGLGQSVQITGVLEAEYGLVPAPVTN